ncbi:MAG: hypothetical protein U0Y10_23250 [Spirosomataceae bacterium]
MKKLLAFGFVALVAWAGFAFRSTPVAYQFTQVTTIESIIPGGTGRSRMITTGADGTLQETEMKHFFSLLGINFQNIRDNDFAITSKVSEMSAAGWELVSVTSGVSSGTTNGQGIFITRYLFKKPR